MEDKNLIVPNIGEFKDVEVIEVLVNEGDFIKKNDPLITIESDKSSVEIPSLLSGKIQKLNVKIGDKVSEGSLIAIIASEEEKQKTIKTLQKTKNNKIFDTLVGSLLKILSFLIFCNVLNVFLLFFLVFISFPEVLLVC